MSASPSLFAARARRAEQETARVLETVNSDRPSYYLNSPGRAGHPPFTKFKPATKSKGAKAWLPFDLFADAEPAEDRNPTSPNAVREYSRLAGSGGAAPAGWDKKVESTISENTPDSLREHSRSPEPAKPSPESLKWSVDSQFDVEVWDQDPPSGPEDPTVLETLPLAPKLIEFSGFGLANKSYISAQPPTNAGDSKKDNKAMQTSKPLGLSFSYPENTRMHHFSSAVLASGPQPSNTEDEQRSGNGEVIKWPAPSRKVFSMRMPVPKKQTQEEPLADLCIQPSSQSEGPRRQAQGEKFAALCVQPPVQSDQVKAATSSRPTHDQILSNLFTVEDLLKQDKVEEEMQARGMSIGVRGIETVQRLAGFPNPLQQLAKSRLAGYAVAKAEKAANAGKSEGGNVQNQVRGQQHDPIFLGQGSQRVEGSFASTRAAYRFDSSGPSGKSTIQSSLSFPSSKQPSHGDLLHHRERPSYNIGFSIAPAPDASSNVHRVESMQQHSSPLKVGQPLQSTQPVTTTSSRDILLKGLQRAITEAEESSLTAHDSSPVKSLTLPTPDPTPLSSKASATLSSLSPSGTRSPATRGARSNIERIGPSDPLPWKERPVHIHTVTSTHATTDDSIEISKPMMPVHATPNGIECRDKKVPSNLAINHGAGPMLEVASQWWEEDKRPDADLRKHLQAIADQDLGENSGLKNKPWTALSAKGPQNAIPEGYCANHLLILLLGSLHEYLVDSPNEQRAMFGSFVEVPEWCVEKGTSGLTSFFGEDWGVPPQRVGRDPRYRPLMHDPRFMVPYDEQEYWDRPGEQWTHARRYR
ncbi:hypothetical protein GP486_002137 [Trichoglossum hirsutum]|uniref:Uncharacterized protein n=1 Tax=Trichoglossum hirsutum TaxID=265104 RepID=A0A9P8LFI2_9PEZI|nr:hypothetical protein GP486_002137 [Trichoglossum hirsutum]